MDLVSYGKRIGIDNLLDPVHYDDMYFVRDVDGNRVNIGFNIMINDILGNPVYY